MKSGDQILIAAFFVPYCFVCLTCFADTGKFSERHEMILSLFFNIF